MKHSKVGFSGWPNSDLFKRSKFEIISLKNTVFTELFHQDLENYKINCEEVLEPEDIMDSQDSNPSPFPSKFFTTFDKFNCININSIINAIGVVISIESGVKTFTTKYDAKCTIKNFKVSDLSKQEVNVALWGEEGDTFSYKLGSIILFEGVKLTNFAGFSLSVLRTTKRKDVSDQQEYSKLSHYWDNHYLNPNKKI